ncbi:hypothetical protein [Shinella sp.]|uniref:hypothetical protein n=1 Tax=Shinella sp. TaxID=1870904 RepID=UPI0029B709BD|nr:hypothetical protein [Shinella sp.]MDX3978044.1 hypothetical protein [Shinella sp.]
MPPTRVDGDGNGLGQRLTDQQKLPRPVYQRVPPGARPPAPSLVQKVLDWVPMRDFLAAQAGFTGRFNRAVKRLDREGGPALPAAQSHFHFGERLVIPVAAKSLTTRLRDNISDRGRLRWIGTHFLDGSDWSGIVEPLENSSSHAEILELIRTRQDFRAGARYRSYAKRINDGGIVKRNRIVIDTIDKLDNYFEYYLALIADIETNGIVPHSDLGLLGQTGRRHRWTRTLWQDLAERDIGVAIDAEGRLVRHTNGKHRMAAALALGIERIPVEIRLVHAGWLRQQADRLGLSPADALLATLEQARATGWPAT